MKWFEPLQQYDVNVLLLFEEKVAPFAVHMLARRGLTSRESEILDWVVQGKTNPEIGTILGISSRTVQKHLERIYRRLGVENRHAAMALVMEIMRQGDQ